MSYQVHNFEDGKVLKAQSLNEMEAGIKDNESKIKVLNDALSANGGASGFTVAPITSGDLNNYLISGFYSICAKKGDDLANMPVQGWTVGVLFVCQVLDTERVTQLYVPVEGTLLYGRSTKPTGEWTPWVQLGGEILQGTGTKPTRLMSQAAITSALAAVGSGGTSGTVSGGGMTSNEIDRRNTLLNMKQLIDISYTAKLPIPQRTGDIPAGTVKGIPYSDVFITDKYIGFDVSLHTFMTSINNPRSDLYLKTCDTPWTKTIYGTACSPFVSYCFGLEIPMSTAEYLKSPDFVQVRPDQVQPCDILLVNNLSSGFGHIIIVEDVEYDQYNMPVKLTICHGTNPKTTRGTWTYSQLLNQVATGGYIVKRYTKLYTVPYTPTPYIHLMNETGTVVYSDICASSGDKATFKAGESITLNILKSEGYEKVVVTKDGVTFGEYGVTEDIPLNNLESGKYVATMYPTNDHCSTSFIVCDVSATKEGNKISFSCTNCTPLVVNGCSGNGGVYEAHKISDAEISLGYKEVVFTDSRIAQYEVGFINEYGRVATYTVEV